MSLCAYCRQQTPGEICCHHSPGYEADWAAGNRAMCDFVHRGFVSPTPRELADTSIDFLASTLEAALSS